jgi:hypothetical protein
LKKKIHNAELREGNKINKEWEAVEIHVVRSSES